VAVPATKRLLRELVRRTGLPVIVSVRHDFFEHGVVLYAYRPLTNTSWVGSLLLVDDRLLVRSAAPRATHRELRFITLNEPRADVVGPLREALREVLDDHRHYVHDELRELVRRGYVDLASPEDRHRLRLLLGDRSS